MKSFPPIAVVGQSCVLPGALSPDELWARIVSGEDLLSQVPPGYWRVPMRDAIATDRGGYVRGFERLFRPEEFRLDAERLRGLDAIFHWVLWGAREALRSAGHDERRATDRAGLVLGNLGYPCESMTRYAESVWLGREQRPAPENRFHFSRPASLAAEALQLGQGGFALDAACASSLYAIKLACDRLHDGSADLMVAGGVNRSDDLFLHAGFTMLRALSATGRSLPFQAEADGLIPAQGAAFVVLKRLPDAVAAGDRIAGVIRGIGLGNDGRSKGLLSPASAGQVRAIQEAYAMADVPRRLISYLECHATGTPVGDDTELQSLTEMFPHRDLTIGSLKSNLGHLITAAGAAGLLKVLAAMKASQLPPMRLAGTPSAALRNSGFRTLSKPENWAGEKFAAVSAFGFGGNNAHLIVQEWTGRPMASAVSVAVHAPAAAVAITGIGVIDGGGRGTDDFLRLLMTGETAPAQALEVALPTAAARFPPKDLEDCEGQQLMLWAAAYAALQDAGETAARRTGIFIGAEASTETARHCAAWRIAEDWRAGGIVPSKESLASLESALPPLARAATVLGTMPNMPANRLNHQYDSQAAGFTLAAGAQTAEMVLRTAIRALQSGEIDMALVGASDLSREVVHRSAIAAPEKAGDAAVVLVLRRLEDARAAGRRIAAVVDGPGAAGVAFDVAGQFGEPFAAAGLLQVAAAALACRHRIRPQGAGQAALPWISATGDRIATAAGFQFSADGDAERTVTETAPAIHCYSGTDRQQVLQALRAGGTSLQAGPSRLVLVTHTPGELAQVRSRAEALLSKATAAVRNATLADGIYYSDAPVGGELAFVFTGAGAAYRGMGTELLLALPELHGSLVRKSPQLESRLESVYGPASGRPWKTEEYLYGSSYLCQLHAALTQDVLGLRPQAAIGLSSGESNSLFAMGAWDDPDGLFAAIVQSGMYSEALAGRFQSVRQSWGLGADEPVRWLTVRVRAPLAAVREAVLSTPRVQILIVHSSQDCLLGGDEAACERVLSLLGAPPAFRSDHSMAVHCAEAMPFAESWWRVHCRPTKAVPGVRFYANATGDSYIPTDRLAADMLLQQALHTVDFPRTVRKAWEDGVRVFVEHGPRNLCCEWIGEILADRPHVSVALDRHGRSAIRQATYAAAQLLACGIAVDTDRLLTLLQPAAKSAAGQSILRFAGHPPAVHIPVPQQEIAFMDEQLQVMAPAPALPESQAAAVAIAAAPLEAADAGEGMQTLVRAVSAAHASAVQQHVRILETTLQARMTVARRMPAAGSLPVRAVDSPRTTASASLRTNGPSPSAPDLHSRTIDPSRTPASGLFVPIDSPRPSAPALSLRTIDPSPPSSASALSMPIDSPRTAAPASLRTIDPPAVRIATSEPMPAAPRFTRAQLLVHAKGCISDIFGPLFRQQDSFVRQVRMPAEPMLLVDRVTGISGEPGSMGLGTIWTETDIRQDSWYLHERRIPGGLLIEAGQADLMLISWLGADFANRGERAYRLLGCELTYHGDLPQVGDTLRYEIHVDGYANQGATKLFFFHYDCKVGDRLCLTVRNGQAGFFTDRELAQATGVLWDPATAPANPQSQVAPPEIQPARSYTREKLERFSRGDAYGCFGAGYEFTAPHKLSPRIPSGKLLLLQEVAELDPDGGPWGRGYMRVENRISSDDWFFEGHFHNDPCMPGTLMAEGCQQALSFYLAALGFTANRDAWRFEPVAEETCRLRCRGQVTPSSNRVVYEIFVEELVAGPYPTVYADVLVTVDGLKALHGRRMGMRLTPDWPLEGRLQLPAEEWTDGRPAASMDGFTYHRRAWVQSALGRPSGAFGPKFLKYDGPYRMARLPGPPFNFVSRLSRFVPPAGKENLLIETEYDIPADAWFYRENGAPVMPISILMEATIQPCGWSSLYAVQDDPCTQDLLFRNLDGTATQHAPIEGPGLLRTRIKTRSVSRSTDMIITSFDVEGYLNDKLIYTLKTSCGFFTPHALANQAGLPPAEEEQKRFERASEFRLELTDRPERYFRRSARLPDSKMLMIDRITGLWEKAGQAGLGRLRAGKDVKPDEWFLKAHFFQDPVQPGSLGVEAMVQTLHFFMLHSGMDEGIPNAEFEAMAIGETVTWKYRGQVLPNTRRAEVEVEIVEVRPEKDGVLVRANAWLWADGMRIYMAKGLAARLRSSDRSPQIVVPHTAVVPHADAVPPTSTAPVEPGTTVLRPNGENLTKYWQVHRPGPRDLLTERLITSYAEKFVRRIAAVSPAKIEALRGSPALFVANHQTLTESILFPLVMPLATATPIIALGRTRVKKDAMVQSLVRLLAARLDDPILYVDQSDPNSMIEVTEQFRRAMVERGRSVLIHAQGVRTLTCREPVRKVSAIVAELAIAAGVPLVPVRLYGGLPVEAVEVNIDFPVGYGAQDYILGDPIGPADLAAMNMIERKRAILDGINGVLPSPADEQPIAPDVHFQSGVGERRARFEMSEWEAVLLQCLKAEKDSRLTDIFPLLKMQ